MKLIRARYLQREPHKSSALACPKCGSDPDAMLVTRNGYAKIRDGILQDEAIEWEDAFHISDDLAFGSRFRCSCGWEYEAWCRVSEVFNNTSGDTTLE